MKVIVRNFIKLLSAGAFNNDASIENMSEYKWNQLFRISAVNNVSDFIASGIIKISASHRSIIPETTLNIATNIHKENYYLSEKEESLKFTQAKANKFSCFYLNHRLNKIVFNEIHSIDTSTDSLIFLNKLIDYTNKLLSKGICLRELAELGLYLRENGDKTDFIKTDRWIRALKMRNITNIIGCYLISAFNFEADEIPFLRKYDKNSYNDIYISIKKSLSTIHDIQDIDKEEENVTSQLYKQNTQTIKYFSYFPMEVTSKFLSNISKSLSNIEE